MKQKCEIWLVIDSDGDYAIGADRNDALDAFDDSYGSSGGPRRVIKITAMVTPPEAISAETEVDVPDEAGETVETEAA